MPGEDVIAQAFVEVLPAMQKFSRDLQRGLQQATGSIARTGTSTGTSWGRSFANSAIAQGNRLVTGLSRTIVAGVETAGVVAGGALVGALFKGFQRVTTIEDALAAITVQLGSATEAGKLLDAILETVRGTPFNLDQFAAAGAQLVSMGVEAEKIPGYLNAIGEAAATKGSRANEFAMRLAAVFGEIQVRGRVMGDDILRLSETGVNALAILANEWGVSTQEMQEMVSKGMIPADRAMDVLAKGIVEGSDGVAGATVAMGGSMEALRKTMSGALGGMQAAVARFGASLITPFKEELAAGFTAMSGILDQLGSVFGPMLQKLADSPGFQKLLAWFETLPEKIGPAFEKLNSLKGIIAPLAAAFAALGSRGIASLLGPFGRLIPVINPVVAALAAIVATSPELRDRFGDLVNAIMPLVEVLSAELLAVITELAEAAVPLLIAAFDILMPVFEWLSDNAKLLAPIILGVIAAFKGLIFVMNTSTFGLWITAIGLLITGLVALWQNSETFRDIVTEVWETIQDVIRFAWENVIRPVWERMQEAGDRWQERWEALRDFFVGIWNAIWGKVGPIIKALADLIVSSFQLWWSIVGPILNGLWHLVQFVWNIISEIIEVALETIVNVIQFAWGIISNVVRVALGVITGIIKVGFNVIWHIIQGVWNVITTVFNTAWRVIVAIFHWAINNATNVINTIRRWVDTVRGVVENIKNAFVTGFDWVREKIKVAIDKIQSFFNGLRDGAAAAFNALIEKVKTPVRALFGWINDNLIKNINKVTSHFDLEIPLLPVNFNKGGIVPGGGPNRDSVFASLTPGEGILTRQATKRLGGKQAIDALNSGDFGQGGPMDWLGAIKDQVTEWLKEGAAFAIRNIFGPVLSKIVDVVPPSLIRDLIKGILNKLMSAAEQWGKDQDEEEAAAKASGSVAGVQPSGWTFPLRGPYSVGRGPVGHGYPAYDFPSAIGTKVVAAAGGKVARAMRLAYSYGIHAFVNHPGGWQTRYAHLSAMKVAVNQILGIGQQIGNVGSTGNSTGPHLHFEVLKNGNRVNPRTILRFDQAAGGTLPRGYSIVQNSTGGPEHLVPRGSGGPGGITVVQHNEITPLDQRIPAMAMVFRELARVEAEEVLREYVLNQRRGGRA